MGITIKGPDVNESYSRFGVNKHGDIRFGIAAIKGVGENVAAAIIQTRNESGPFTSIYDFVERVPLSYLNRRTFESLALAGAFDCFSDEIQREDFLEKDKRDQAFSELLLRYGQAYQNAKQESAASLFGDDPSMTTAGRPPVRHAVPWASSYKLDR